VHLGAGPVRPPEASGQKNERCDGGDTPSVPVCLDRRVGGAYDSRSAWCRVTVPRLPTIYFEKLVEHSPDIVVAVDRHGTIIFYNDGARQMLGYAADEVLGQHVTRLYPDLDEARKVMRAMRDGEGRVKNHETVFLDKGGLRIPVAISGSLIRDEQGGELGSIGFAKDLRDIRRRDRLATLGEVAVSLAHEINNPLEVIVNNLSLLEQYVERVSTDDDFVVESERVDSVRLAVARIQEIVAQLAARAQEAEYATREYLPGTRMTDLRPAEARAAARSQHDAALEGLRILVVDDDLGVCLSLRDLLTQAGCEVTVATGGREALARLESESVDLVLSDVVMPDLDGHALFLEVRKRHPDVPVVLMTAFHYDKDHIIKRSKLAGLDDVLYKKPIDPPRLRDIIKRHARRTAAAL
jgi:PAS domain S-box-containing protein